MVFSDLSFSPQSLLLKTAKWYMGLQYPTSPSANLCRTFSQPTAVDESNIWMQS